MQYCRCFIHKLNLIYIALLGLKPSRKTKDEFFPYAQLAPKPCSSNTFGETSVQQGLSSLLFIKNTNKNER